MTCIATLAARPASVVAARRGHPPATSFPTYERLLRGERDVSLQAILGENPMLGVMITQQINHGRVEVLDVAIDPSSGRLIDLRLRRRGVPAAGPLGPGVPMAGTGSQGPVRAPGWSVTGRHAGDSELETSADWTLHMLLRDLQDASAALNARLEPGDDWVHVLDDDLTVARIGRSQPVLLAWDTTQPAGREMLTAYEGWPRGWKRHLALLLAFRTAAARVVQAPGHRLRLAGIGAVLRACALARSGRAVIR